MRRLMVTASALLLAALALAAWLESQRVKPVALIPTLTGKVEYCLSCHADLPEISSSHSVAAFGCVACHGGEPLALQADLAHSTMRGGKNPSDFSVVQSSCGGEACHSGSAAANRDHIQRASTSIQATYAGAIALMRYTFGAQPSKSASQAVRAYQVETSKTGITSLAAFDPSGESNPKLQLFGQDCLHCHLWAVPMEYGGRYDHFTGCAACHTPTQGINLTSANSGTDTRLHKLTTAISYTQCNTCHNRGNYDLRTMTFASRTDQPNNRLEDVYQPIAQFTRCEYTLDCIDCHTRAEVMGDGSLYGSKFDIQYTRCKTCHGTPTELPRTLTLTDPDDIAFRMTQLNPVIELKVGDTILVTEKEEPLWNTRVMDDGTYQLIGKATGQVFAFKPVMGSGCTQDPTRQASSDCHQCHEMKR